jgi:hypothetical protein
MSVTISGLPAASALTGSELVPVVQSSATVRTTTQDIADLSAGLSFANPSGTVGLTVVNGVATTAPRSDSAPALSQSITPTWTGAHTFSAAVALNGATTVSGTSINSTALFTSGTLGITRGGTGQATANAALNALLPSQGAHSGEFLTTNGTDSSWAAVSATPGVNNVGYLNVPQNTQNGDYTLVLADAGKHVYTDDTGTHAWTIPPNASVAFPIGTAITLVTFDPTGVNFTTVERGAGVSLYESNGSLTDADFDLAALGIATILKVETNAWVISGAAFEV